MAVELYHKYQSYSTIDSDNNGEIDFNDDYLEPLMTFDGKEFWTSEELTVGATYVDLSEIEQVVRSPIVKRYTRYYLLHSEDETIKKEITQYIASSGSIEKNNEVGQSRSTSLTFINMPAYKTVINDYNNYGQRSNTPTLMWNPNQAFDDFETNAKIKIVTGLEFQGFNYEIDEGIFVIFDPKMSQSGANNSLTFQCYDKFALLDGTIDGKGEFDYEIPVNTPICDAIRLLLRLPKNNRGEPYDVKDIIFPAKYKGELLAYTIKKTADNAIGELIKEMCKSISCDVKYNTQGNLVVTDTLDDLDVHHRKVSWTYDEQSPEYQNPSIDIKRSSIKNKVVVVGANINGFLCKGVAENTNPNSLYNINGSFGVKSIKITDNLIPSNRMCEERAKYELDKYMKNYVTLSFQSVWIPHLEPGDIIRWTKEDWGIENEEFLVKTVSLPLNGKDFMSLSLVNTKEISR